MTNCNCKKPDEYVKDSGEHEVGPEIWLMQSLWCRTCKRFVRYKQLSKRKRKG